MAQIIQCVIILRTMGRRSVAWVKLETILVVRYLFGYFKKNGCPGMEIKENTENLSKSENTSTFHV